MNPSFYLALALADSLLAGQSGVAGMVRSVRAVVGDALTFPVPLCRSLHRRCGAHLFDYTRTELAPD